MSLLVTPDATVTRARVRAEPPLLIDLRPVEDYCENHLPGAVHLDLFGISSIDTDPAPLNAFFWIIEHLLASRGVSNDVPVVVYDDTSGIVRRAHSGFSSSSATRTRVCSTAAINAWTTTRAAADAASAEADADRAGPAARDEAILAGWRDVSDRLGQSDAVILDTRSDGEYCGTTVRAARGGAVPGAVHLEWTNNLGARRRVQERWTS